MEKSGRTARVWRYPSRSKAESFCLFVRASQLFAGEKLLKTGIFTAKLFRYGRGGEFLEARIVPERIEHRIEPEQRRSERATRESAIV